VVFGFIGCQFLPFLLPFRVFRFSIGLFILGSWIGELSRQLNVLLWNTGGLTALDGICTACTSPSGYGTFLILTGALMTVPALLFGGVVLTNNSNRSSGPPTSRERARFTEG